MDLSNFSHEQLYQDYQTLNNSLHRILKDLGEIDLADLIIDENESSKSGTLSFYPEKTSELLSLSFQLLNMSEENIALSSDRAFTKMKNHVYRGKYSR